MNNIDGYSTKVKDSIRLEIEDLLRSIKRPNADIEGLINKLESSDFFTAPASTKYHNAYRGGLAEHSLNVYYNLKSLVELKGLKETITDDNIIICGLLHDISKINFYEVSSINKKVYHEYGTKFDELGRFDWQSVAMFRVKDVDERFIYGTHEENSEFMIRTFIPLELCESIAILNYRGGKSHDNVWSESPLDKYNKYVLVSLLHVADFMATFIDEK